MAWATRTWRSVTTIERGVLTWTAAVRAAVMVTAVALAALATDRVGLAVAPIVALLFIAVTEPLDTEGRRLVSLLWATWWISLGVLIGSLVADAPVIHVLVAAAMAAATGFAGALGPRAAMNGVLTLVVFVIWAGSPADYDAKLTDSIGFALGALAMTAVIMAPALAGRARSPRLATARLLLALGRAGDDTMTGIASANHALREQQLVDIISRERLSEPARAWANRLATDAHRLRIGLFGLVATDAADARVIIDAAQPLCRLLSRCLVRPWRSRRDLAAIETTRRHLAGVPRRDGDELERQAGDEVIASLDALTAEIVGPWPAFSPRTTGATAGRAAPISHRQRIRAGAQRMRSHVHRSDPLLRHALRLAATITIATVVARLLDLPHSYWLPLTVAWVSKPTLADTTTKVAARTIGTILGVLAAATLIEVIGPPDWIQALVLGIASALVLAFMVPNYTITVIGMTTFVFVLFNLAGDQLTSSFASRALATVLGSALVYIAAMTWPTRSGGRVTETLRDYSRAIARYSAAVLSGTTDQFDTTRAEVLRTRAAAADSLGAADGEPGQHALPPATRHEIADALQSAAGHTLIRETRGTDASDTAVAATAADAFDALGERLDRIATGHDPDTAEAGAMDPGAQDPGEHPIQRASRRAHHALDEFRRLRSR